jgi:DNA repair exonuclease SbcCD ATPase subunit
MDNQAVISEYINELKKSISELAADSALAKAQRTVLTASNNAAIAERDSIITSLNDKVVNLETSEKVQVTPKDEYSYGDEVTEKEDDFTYGNDVEPVAEEVDDFTYANDVEPVTEEVDEVTEELTQTDSSNKSTIEVDLFRQVEKLKASTAEQEDYIVRLEAGIAEGNTVIADAEGSRDEALQKLKDLKDKQDSDLQKVKDLESSRNIAIQKIQDLESSRNVALQKAKELEEKLKQRPAPAPVSNVVSMNAKKLQEDFIKLEIQNSKLMRDLGSAENKIKELKNKATKSKK